MISLKDLCKQVTIQNTFLGNGYMPIGGDGQLFKKYNSSLSYQKRNINVTYYMPLGSSEAPTSFDVITSLFYEFAGSEVTCEEYCREVGMNISEDVFGIVLKNSNNLIYLLGDDFSDFRDAEI